MTYVEGKSTSRSLDLVAGSVLACAAVAAAFSAGVPTVVRVLLGLPLVLVLPGYALTAAAMPRLGRWGPDKAVLTLGTSIAVAVLGGLVLNFTSWGLERRSWSVLLAAFTVVAATGAAVRRAGEAAAPRRSRARAQPIALLVLAVAALIAVAAVGISRRGAMQSDQLSRFTQMSMLPVAGKHELRIGVINREGSARHYRIVVRAGGRTLVAFRAVAVASGASWSRVVAIPANPPSQTRIEADLYRAARPTVLYRHVTFWTK